MRVRVSTNTAEAIKLGRDPATGREFVEVDLAALTQAQRDELALTRQDGSESYGDTLRLSAGIANQETVAAALDAAMAERAANEVEHARQLEALVRKYLAMPQAEFNATYIYEGGGCIEYSAIRDPRLADKMSIRITYRREVEAGKKAAEEAAKKREAEAQERREAEAERTKATREAERAAWIAANGSDFLKTATARGYNCERVYLSERVALELGAGWEVRDKCDYKSRSCPSPEALNLEVELEGKGIKAEVVWLTDDGVEQEYGDSPFEPCEAIVVENYLSNHILVKII